jgi:hypothetical protein
VAMKHSQQVYSASVQNPNSKITPENPQLPAIYYANNATSVWIWSVDSQTWIQIIGNCQF